MKGIRDYKDFNKNRMQSLKILKDSFGEYHEYFGGKLYWNINGTRIAYCDFCGFINFFKDGIHKKIFFSSDSFIDDLNEKIKQLKNAVINIS